jgi:hypothetical protein
VLPRRACPVDHGLHRQKNAAGTDLAAIQAGYEDELAGRVNPLAEVDRAMRAESK